MQPLMSVTPSVTDSTKMSGWASRLGTPPSTKRCVWILESFSTRSWACNGINDGYFPSSCYIEHLNYDLEVLLGHLSDYWGIALNHHWDSQTQLAVWQPHGRPVIMRLLLHHCRLAMWVNTSHTSATQPNVSHIQLGSFILLLKVQGFHSIKFITNPYFYFI